MATIVPYGGNALNAVDAKGRVSLPAEIRRTIDRRIALAQTAGLPVEPNRIYVREHLSKPCLVGFDETEYFRKAERLDQRDVGEVFEEEALEGSSLAEDLFGDLHSIAFDNAGRMVLNQLLRDITGITGFAFFRGLGREFEIWEPAALHAWAKENGKRPLVRTLEHVCPEKGIAL